MGVSRFVYRLLLLAFPADVRREFGDDMSAMFAMQMQEVRARRERVTRLWIRAIGDALVNGAAERFGAPARKRAGGLRGTKPPGHRWRWWVHAFFQDVKYALRVLARQPGVTGIAVLTLALGIGANSAIFSAVNAVLLRPLPYDQPARIVTLWEKRPNEGVLDNPVSPADFVDWTKLTASFESMAAFTPTASDLTGTGDPVRLFAGVVSPSFFDVLRVQPMLGRGFRAEESTVGQHQVAILGHQLWTTRFGADPGAIGRNITLNGVPFQVVGVLPKTFEFPDDTLDLWVPLALEGLSEPLPRASHQLAVYARLKDGVTIEQARADMDRVGKLLEQQYPDTNRGHGGWVTSLDDYLKTPVKKTLLLLLGAVAFVLLIACVNVANILLAKAAGRRREMAVRAAVGAGRARLAGQMLTESLVLAALGGLAGLFVAWWGIALLRQLTPQNVPLVGLSHLTLEPRIVAFTAVLSLLTGVLFGFLPAWHLAGQDVNVSLKDGGRSPGSVRRHLRAALVVSEIALASLLLVAAGLTLRSFQSVLDLPAGIRTEGRLTAGLTLPASRYPTPASELTTFAQIEEKLRALPGVRAVGATNLLPLSGRDGRRGVSIEGRPADPDVPTRAHPRSVTPGYFEAIGITLLGGRGFTNEDGPTAPKVAIVNDTMARRYWPGASPIGRRIRLSDSDWIEVVGVIADVKHWGLDAVVNPEMYFPYAQSLSRGLTFVIAADGDPASLAPAVRDRVQAIDPSLPLSSVRTMDQIASTSVASRRAAMLLLAVFGGLALALAAAGIHGVMSHLVALRRGEIGVRMTLGASPAAVMGLILREGALQAIAGLAIGLSGGVLIMRGFRTMLFGVAPADPLTLAAVAAGLLAVALAACAIPARKAMCIDPVAALRS